MGRILSQAEFEQVQADVMASAPPNLDEATFTRWYAPQLAAALAEAESRDAPLEGTPAGRFASSFGAQVNPLAMVSGIYQSIKSPEAIGRTLEGIVGASVNQGRQAVDAFRQGHYIEAAGHGAAAALPVIGPASAAAADQMVAGDVYGGLGTGAGLIAGTLLPSTAKAVAGAPVLAKARGKVADVIGSAAIPLARAGVKAPLSLLKQQAGASQTGVNFQAIRLAKFLIDNRILEPGQATRIIRNTQAQLDRILAAKGTLPTDAPGRAAHYLNIFEQQAAKALSPDHAAAVRAAVAQMPEGPLGETVPVPSTSGAAGEQFTRVLRDSVPAEEALSIARASSRFETRRSWGEQKGTPTEAIKAQERAVRDAFKITLPEARTVLERQGQAILAETVLDRKVWREANRDVLSLPGLVGLSSHAVVGFAAHWLRNHQLRAGIWADQLATAIRTNNAPAAAGILSRLKVRLPQLGVLLDPQQPWAPQVPAPAAVSEEPTMESDGLHLTIRAPEP